jgi:hypothetical protein
MDSPGWTSITATGWVCWELVMFITLTMTHALPIQLAVSGIESSADIFDLSLDPDNQRIMETLGEVKYTFSSKYSHRFNSRNYLNTGFVYDFYDVQL